jgi:hypothetical protein
MKLGYRMNYGLSFGPQWRHLSALQNVAKALVPTMTIPVTPAFHTAPDVPSGGSKDPPPFHQQKGR